MQDSVSSSDLQDLQPAFLCNLGAPRANYHRIRNFHHLFEPSARCLSLARALASPRPSGAHPPGSAASRSDLRRCPPPPVHPAGRTAEPTQSASSRHRGTDVDSFAPAHVALRAVALLQSAPSRPTAPVLSTLNASLTRQSTDGVDQSIVDPIPSPPHIE